MITIEEKKRLKEILGNDYVPKVRFKLKEKGYLKTSGKEYSDSSIKGTLNEGQNNSDIVECIYEVYYEKLHQLDSIREMRKNLLKGSSTAKIQPSSNS